MQETVSLVLGSGGARGLAHIGVIECLEENGYRIESISGCSMGALVGGIYAAGKLNVFENWVRSVTRLEIVTLLDLAWSKSGLVKGDKIINTLKELVGDVTIEDLPIAYTAVAADIENEKEIWLNSGSLFDAIRASISLPLFFTPFRYRDLNLIDGGVLNPVPIAPTFRDGTDLTIAVNLGGKALAAPTAEVPEAPRRPGKSPITDRITERINEFIDSFTESAASVTHIDWDAYDVANQAFDAMQGTIARQKLAAYPADRYIEIARNACSTLEFDRADEMIELGYRKTEEMLGISA